MSFSWAASRDNPLMRYKPNHEVIIPWPKVSFSVLKGSTVDFLTTVVFFRFKEVSMYQSVESTYVAFWSLGTVFAKQSPYKTTLSIDDILTICEK